MQLISVGIVARNEEYFLPDLLNDLINQSYPHENMEILLIDSMSNDRTKQIMLDFQKENPDFFSVRVLENEQKITAAGLNMAIDCFQGEALARVDAHVKLPYDYVEKVVAAFDQGEMVVGGKRPSICEDESPWGEILLQVESSLFGSGISLGRRSEETTYLNTLFQASYQREVLEKVGHFSETLLRTEDNEFHYRIREAGYKLYYDPTIESFQYVRSSFAKMLKQKYQNGYWIGQTLKICPQCLSWFHMIPCLFVFAIVITSILAASGFRLLGLLMWGAYGLFAVVNTLISTLQNRFYLATVLMPFMFLIMHVGYGVGTWVGLLSHRLDAS